MIEGCYRASSVQEALAYLATHRGRAQLVAGGTQLMPLIESGEALAVCLVDISGINALRRITEEDSHLVMGSAVTLQMMADHPLVHSKAPLLIEAIRKTRASVQPNTATLGGAVATSCGTSEIAVALVTLDTEAQITNLTGSQWLPLSCLLAKSGFSRVDSTSEIVTALRCAPLVEGQGAAMGRVQPAGSSDTPFPGPGRDARARCSSHSDRMDIDCIKFRERRTGSSFGRRKVAHGYDNERSSGQEYLDGAAA